MRQAYLDAEFSTGI